MSGLDSAIGSLVQQVLSGLGENSGINLTASCILNVNNRNYDPLSGNAPAAQTATFPLNCTPPDMFQQSQINNTTIKRGDFRIWISATQLAAQKDAPTPEVGMSVTFNDFEYDIAGVEPVYVGNVPVMYGLHCRE